MNAEVATDVRLPWLLTGLTGIPWAVKRRILERPNAWRYYSSVCRRAGWGGRYLGWHTPRNGPFAGVRLRAMHANHLWVPVGAYEPGVSAVVADLVREAVHRDGGLDVWDIGANVGRFALLCAKHGASSVLAVEPSDANVAVLDEHLAANVALARRVRVLRAAVADLDGMMDLVVNRDDGAVCQLKARGVTQYDHGDAEAVVSVATLSLDAMRRTHGSPGLVKIDVEGAEALALRGASALLATERPAFLIEIHNADAARDCLAALNAASYRIRRVTERGQLVDVDSTIAYGHVLAQPRG